MKQAGVDAFFLNDFILCPKKYKHFSASRRHKLLKDKKVDVCISFQCNADNHRARLVVVRRDRERFTHFQCVNQIFTITPGLEELLLHAACCERSHGLWLL